METGLQGNVSELSDDRVRQMLVLAGRLREQNGGELDDPAILAVAEATGATPEYVRLAVRLLPEARRQNFFHRIRSAFLTLEPDVRRHVLSALVASSCALFRVLAQSSNGKDLFGTLLIVMFGVGIWNVSVSKDSRVASISGAFFGGIYYLAQSLFLFLGSMIPSFARSLDELRADNSEPFYLVFYVFGGALAGLLIHKLIARQHVRFGIKDPVQERQELLRQLVTLQDKLRSGEQSMTFLSLDIVGSTKMKAHADPLSVEFTFTEYHQFVESVTKRYGGRVHSTAGDGVTCAFPHPQQAYSAAKNIQTGIVEVNTFRNKIGMPIVLRAGIHTGSVNAPTPDDIKSVNFAHVIDVAAHLQHASPPGGIAVSESSASLLPGGASTVGARKIQTDDAVAYIWEPRQQLLALEPGLPPPAPDRR